MNLLRIAFVAFNKNPERFLADASYIYRCENLALALQAKGHHVDLLHYSQISSDTPYDLVYFHRPNRRFGLSHFIRKLKKKGCQVIADFDDLVFDPAWAMQSPGVINGQVSLHKTEKAFMSHHKALARFDRVVVSTEPLASKIRYLFPGVVVLVVPNTVHYSWYQSTLTEPMHREQKILTYFPGTRSHDKDFAMIKAPLAEFLHEHPEVQLNITGVLNLSLKCRPGQLVKCEKQTFRLYKQHVYKSWLNIAPLEETEFNKHKSAIKVIEAGYWNTPTVASPIPDVKRLVGCGALLAHNAHQWFSTLKSLTSDVEYQRHNADLRQRLLSHASVEQQADRLLEFAFRL